MKKEINQQKKYLVVHGHFYQPPRENPWLEEIEIQKSAYPFHDWNERINFECYKPNAFSKIFGKDGKIVKMVNNYARMSFNFGPTLLSWLEKHDEETYEKIIEADKITCKKYNGHGNAVAQVYNHIIMPLANEKDKDTQIKWGIFDFEKRFGRKPEGMWLAETGIDYKTIDKLIENDIKYTILSPYQAHKVRAMDIEEIVEDEDDDQEGWTDVLGAKIVATRPYRCYSKTDPEKYIDIFFYDGPISSGIGFEDTVNNSGNFIGRLKLALVEDHDHPQVVNVATDGETYGHHKKFADLTLAHLLYDIADQEGFELTNYGYYLSKYPPEYEVIINEGKGQGTAWSCAHGVDRWQDNCGCCTGMHGGWNQEWRKPLRDGLNSLRDKLKKVYEKEALKYLKDIWGARNRYISVILDRSNSTSEEFLIKESKRELIIEEKNTVLKLMEMQRNSLLMFTSCGWFFDEMSGLETQQILMYAAKAIQIAQEFTNEDLESDLTEYLDRAKSNIHNFGTGKNIYRNFVKSNIVDFNKIVAHNAIRTIVEPNSESEKVYTFEIEKEDSYKVVEGNLTFALGKVKVKDLITYETRHMVYGVIRFGNMDFRCSVKNIFSNIEYIDIKKEILSKLENRFSIVEAMRGLDIYIGTEYYTFKDLLLEEKRDILQKITGRFFEDYRNMYEKIYIESSSVVEALMEAELQIPEEYRISAEYTLTSRISKLADLLLENTSSEALKIEMKALISNARKWNYNLNLKQIEYNYIDKVSNIMKETDSYVEESFSNLLELYKVADILGININTNYVQFKLFSIGNVHFKKLNDKKKEVFLEVAKYMGFLEEAF